MKWFAASIGALAMGTSAQAGVYTIDFESLAAGTQLTSSVQFNGNANASFDSRFIAPGNIEYSTIQAIGNVGPLTGNVARTGMSSGNTTIGSVDFHPIFVASFYLGGIAVGHDAPQDTAMRITVFGMGGSVLAQRNFILPAAGAGQIVSSYVDLSDIPQRAFGFALQNPGGVQSFGSHFYWDNFTYSDSPVPTPGAFVIAGVAGVAVLRRRR